MDNEEIINKVANQMLNTMIELNKELKFNSNKCIGIGGRLFGHKFTGSAIFGEHKIVDLPKCQRCGWTPE